MSDHGIDCSDTRYLILYFEILKEKKHMNNSVRFIYQPNCNRMNIMIINKTNLFDSSVIRLLLLR